MSRVENDVINRFISHCEFLRYKNTNLEVDLQHY